MASASLPDFTNFTFFLESLSGTVFSSRFDRDAYTDSMCATDSVDSAEDMDFGGGMVIGVESILELSHFISWVEVRAGGREYLGEGVFVWSVWVYLEVPLLVPLSSPSSSRTNFSG